MSLLDRTLQMVDVFDFLFIDTDGNTIFSAQASKSGLEQSVEAIDIYSGIGNQRKCRLKTKKQMKISASFAEFALEYLAAQCGVNIDTTVKRKYAFDEETAVTTQSATIADATEILKVTKLDGTKIKIVTTDPASVDEVKVDSTTLTFHDSFTDTKVLVSYIGTTTKECAIVKFNAKTFSKTGRIIMKSVAYDQETEEIYADVAIEFYKGNIDDNFNLEFSLGNAIETAFDVEITTADLLPDGTKNIAQDLGMLVVTER